jgi:hypothetical protein
MNLKTFSGSFWNEKILPFFHRDDRFKVTSTTTDLVVKLLWTLCY